MASHEHHHLAIEHEKPDSWHRHTPDEGTPMAEHGAIASPAVLAKVYIAMCVVVVSTVLFLGIFFMSYLNKERAKQQETTVLSQNFNEMKSHLETELSSYGWADAKAGTVRIPIEKAMGLVVEKYKKSSASAPETK